MSFDDIVAGLEFEDPTDVEDLSTFKDKPFALMDRINEIDEQLKNRGEVRFPNTQRGRDLHSQRAALRIIELQMEKEEEDKRGK